ncbi:MAG: aminoacyl-tRNA hydrolase [Candidatus Marinimicrobia bacterium]|nr:aminoacyl-tRNA hydrolase [Candidatus Neomarinimicrobiota bacterium]MCF7829048.1 aminoacyl-tRNA hydrolase [Candidatus Neomarinimicrobiota bacterium]MCF7881815.1 aminoacyl-tRNA hydrolase [Candidatus Neomarinimicrobiota bacterium]
MKYIIGLGNPGKKYRETRHNIGFRIIDFLTEKQHVTLMSGKGEYLLGEHRSGKYALVKPLTYMNNSGNAITDMQRHRQVKLRETLVVYDDLDLPLGTMRFRPGGSAGTHRGMESVVDKIGTTRIPRLRIGIGSEYKTGPSEDFVLTPFATDELPVVQDVVKTAADGIMSFIHEGIQRAMNTYNKRDLAT